MLTDWNKRRMNKSFVVELSLSVELKWSNQLNVTSASCVFIYNILNYLNYHLIVELLTNYFQTKKCFLNIFQY